MVTRNTSWRGLGKVPYETWRDVILGAGGLPEYAAYEVWLALGDDSALALQQLREESSFASDFEAIPADWWNAWNLQIDGKGIKNKNAVEAAKAWRSRVYDPSYKNGVYANTDTIEEFFNAYAPEWDNNDTEAYIRESVDGINRLGLLSSGGGNSPVALSIRQMMIPAGNVNRPGTKLNDEPLWITIHETSNYNVGADAEMHAIFCRNGGGSETVSFHGTVDDGEFIQLLPFDEVGWHAGDGCDNRDTDKGCFASVAIETCVNADGSWSVTKENLIDGCVAIIKGDSRFNFAGRKGKFSPTRLAQHNKWSGKNCPERIRAEGSWGRITSQIASESAGIPVDPTGPETPPADEIFSGLDIAVAKRLFGSPKGEDGKTYSFDPNGPVSKNWLARGEETGEWPALTEVWVYSDGRKYFHFEDGYTILDPAGEAPPKTLKP